MALKVRCPNCKNMMLYQPLRGAFGRKSCVYCGKNFKVEKDTIVSSNVN